MQFFPNWIYTIFGDFNKMATRKGTLLERNVDTIFSSLGFTTETNVRLNGYEIDILAQQGNNKIIVECKQYESGSLTIRNLIHEWADKGNEIGADRIILVLYGVEIKDSDYNLARQKNMTLWDEEKVIDYINLIIQDKENAKEKLLDEISVDEKPQTGEKEQLEESFYKKKAEELILWVLYNRKTMQYVSKDLYIAFCAKNFLKDLKRYGKSHLLKTAEFLLSELDEDSYVDELMGNISYRKQWNKLKSHLAKEYEEGNDPHTMKFALDCIQTYNQAFEEALEFIQNLDKTSFRRKTLHMLIDYNNGGTEIELVSDKDNSNCSVLPSEEYFLIRTSAFTYYANMFRKMYEERVDADLRISKLKTITSEIRGFKDIVYQVNLKLNLSNKNRLIDEIEYIFLNVFEETDDFIYLSETGDDSMFFFS